MKFKMSISIFIYFFVLATLHSSFASAKFIDLSYSLGNNTIAFPGSKDFKLNRDKEGYNGEFWYSSFSFCMGEHAGTHLDAPYHFHKDGWTVDQIPDSHLINVSAVVIDIEKEVSAAPSPALYKLQVEDLVAYERMTGRQIPLRSLIFVHTGWSKLWPNKISYLGYKNESGGETSFSLRFPGISEDAIRWLSEERQIVGIGIDTASVDSGDDKHYPVHVYGGSRQIYNIENVANLHLLLCNDETKGCNYNFRAFVLPIKIIGGTGAPARILVVESAEESTEN